METKPSEEILEFINDELKKLPNQLEIKTEQLKKDLDVELKKEYFNMNE